MSKIMIVIIKKSYCLSEYMFDIKMLNESKFSYMSHNLHALPVNLNFMTLSSLAS